MEVIRKYRDARSTRSLAIVYALVWASIAYITGSLAIDTGHIVLWAVTIILLIETLVCIAYVIKPKVHGSSKKVHSKTA